MAHVLLAEDERVVRMGYVRLLEGEGYSVKAVKNGDEAVAAFSECRPDLVILDINMPKVNGFAACEKIRELDRRVPIVFLTANGSESSEIRAMGIGADDFIGKDESAEILLARIRRAIDRQDESEKPPPREQQRIRLDTVSINLASHAVECEGRRLAVLTQTELDVLMILYNRRGDFLTPAEIISELRGAGFACEDTMLYVHMYNMRRKLGPASDLIESLRHTGYRLNLA